MDKKGKYAKSGTIVITLLMVLTVFSVMGMASAHTAVSATNVQVLTKTLNIAPSDVKYVSGPTGHYVIVKGLRLAGVPGSPAIPVKGMRFKLPANAKIVGVQVSTGAATNFGAMKISPARAPVLKDGYKIPAKFAPPSTNSLVYSANNFYPQKNMIYRVENNGRNTYVYVYLFPVKYNPVSNDVKIIKDMTVTVQYTLSGLRAGSAPIDVENIIITSPELKAQAQRLADFHNSTGVPSYVVTTSWIASHFAPAINPPLNGYGNSTTDPYPYFYNQSFALNKEGIVGYNFTLAKKIIAFLQNESQGNNVTYVTIFGNARMVPPSYYYVDQEFYAMAYLGYGDYYDAWIPTDALYASPNYNNTTFSYTPTFEVGRLPVNTFTAGLVVDKIIHYATNKTKGIQNITLSGGQVFETPYFLGETGVLEPLNNGWFDGLNVTEYFHTLRNFTYNNFMKMMQDSDMIVEVTHGSGFSFWHHNDEVSAWEFPTKGSYGSLPVYISGSCLNGAWDEEMYPSYEMSSGLNGGTSIAEQMLYSPKGIIAYFGADREALGSTWAYFDHGTLVAPNDFGDLITEDGTAVGYAMGAYYGHATIGLMGYYAKYAYDLWIPWLNQRDPYEDGLNDNPWARSYFEYSVLGDPALQVGGNGGSAPANNPPNAIINNATYDSQDMPIITRGKTVTVSINATSSKVKAELLYLEHNYGMSPYGGMQSTYYDFILNTTELSNISYSNGTYFFKYSFTPAREGMYILSLYTPDGKNTRFYMDCQMPEPPALHLALKAKKYLKMSYANKDTTYLGASGPDVRVVTLIDTEQVAYGKETNVTAVLYNGGNTPATNVNVSFYLENYTLVFQSKNLSHPLVNLGYKVVSSIPAGGFAYVTIPWKAYNLWAMNHSWDPFNSSARWQYVVASAQVTGDTNMSNNANWALFRVHLKVDVWAQKVFLQKDPVLNESNNVSLELTNVGTSITSNTTVYVMDDFTTIGVIPNVKIAPGQTVFFTVPWTPAYGGWDDLYVVTVTPGDNNSANDVGQYYPNGYWGVSSFMVLTYDVGIVNVSSNVSGTSQSFAVQFYNYGPLASNPSTLTVTMMSGITTVDVESPHPYPNNYMNVWEIDSPSNLGSMMLHFAYLDVEPGYDVVQIYDANWNLLEQYSGFYSNMWTPEFDTSTVYVVLLSDEAVNYTGFKIDAIANMETQIATVNVPSIASGHFATVDIHTNYHLGGNVSFNYYLDTPGEEATLTTGGATNNMFAGSIKYAGADTSAPVLTPVSPVGPTNDPNPVIVVNYTDKQYSGFKDVWINITNPNGFMMTPLTILYSGVDNGSIIGILLPLDFADGVYTVTVTVIDNGGNRATVSWNFVIDTKTPKLEISTPTNVPLTYDSTFWINGTTDPGVTITINGEKVNVDATGAFSYKTTLVEGQNVFVVKATDPAGNTETVLVTVLYLPDLPKIWDQINAINAEISNITSELSSINTQISSLQSQVNALNDQLSALEKALSENITMLEKAIKDNNTALIKMVKDNVTQINDEITALKNKADAIKSEMEDVNAKQNKSIDTNELIGIAGIVLAIVAIIIALVSMMRKGKPGVPAANSEPETEEVNLDEETSEEEEDLEEI